MDSNLLRIDRVTIFFTAVSLLLGMLGGCGYTVSSPPVPTTVQGYSALIGDRTFQCEPGEAFWRVRMQLRSDGTCTITMRDAGSRTRTAIHAAQTAFGGSGGDGRWFVKQDGELFMLIVAKQDGSPWASGKLVYKQQTDVAEFKADAVYMDVYWELAEVGAGSTMHDAARTWWYAIARDQRPR